MLYREIPFLRIILPLCLGIIAGLYIHPGIYAHIILITISLSGLILSLWFNRRLTNYLFGISLSLALFSSGLILYTNEKERITNLKTERTLFLSELSDYPEEKENSYMLTVRLKGAISGKDTTEVEGSMVLYYRKDSIAASLLPGDILLFNTTPVEIVNRGNPEEFDYRFFMLSKGIKYYGFTSRKDIVSIREPEHLKIRYRALIIREKIIDMYKKRGITGERLALVAAITLGQKNMLDPEQKQNFIKAGIMHIMAVSGLHAVILSLFIFNLLFFLKRKFNVLRIVITIVFLWSFAFVTGLTPSVLRATLMFSFLQAGDLMKRRVNGINSVLASAFILIILRPSVIFDAGFLLSYSAVLFIIGFYRDFYQKINFRYWFPEKIWESVVVTLVAQAGTLPLTITLFNRFPTYFILTNLIIVPLSSILIIVGCLVPMTFPIIPVSKVLALILDRLTGLTELLTAKAAALPFSTIDNIGLSPLECILLSAAVALLMVFIARKQTISIIYPVATFLIFSTVFTINEFIKRRSGELIVYNSTTGTTVGIRNGNHLNIYTTTSEVPPEVIKHASSQRLDIKMNRLSAPVLLKAGSSLILITDTLRSVWLNENPLTLIILKGRKPVIEQSCFKKPAKIPRIIYSEAVMRAPDRDSKPLSVTASEWFVRKSGAYRLKLRE